MMIILQDMYLGTRGIWADHWADIYIYLWCQLSTVSIYYTTNYEVTNTKFEHVWDALGAGALIWSYTWSGLHILHKDSCSLDAHFLLQTFRIGTNNWIRYWQSSSGPTNNIQMLQQKRMFWVATNSWSITTFQSELASDSGKGKAHNVCLNVTIRDRNHGNETNRSSWENDLSVLMQVPSLVNFNDLLPETQYDTWCQKMGVR